MRYIDFYCKRHELKAWKKWVKDSGREGDGRFEDEDDDNENGLFVASIERGPQVMDYYFRLLCIAAYRRIAGAKKAKHDVYSKKTILETLLKVCPDTAEKLGFSNNDKQTKAAQKMLDRMFPEFSNDKNAPKVDMQLLETDFTVRHHLAAIGLHPMADWCMEGYQGRNISSDIIIACAKMFTEYLKDVPAKAKDLKGTPYAKSKENKDITDNLDNNGCVAYKGVLEPAFRNAAQFGLACHGIHT